MKCPECNSDSSKVLQTLPAHSREDGHNRRRRECLACQHRFSTHEILEEDLDRKLPGFKSQSTPLPTIPQSVLHLVDIEAEMESLLLPSIAALHEALAAPDQASAPAKVKVDVARWVVSDRREHRRNLAQALNAENVQMEDPAMSQLMAALALSNLELNDDN